MAASLVLGQGNFTSRGSGVTSTNLSFPNSVAVDASGNVWVDDFNSNRVLEYAAPITMGEPASVVLGQPNFTSRNAGLGPSNLSGPTTIAFAPNGNLWVSEFGDARVLEFVPPFFTGMDASILLGQSSFESSSGGTSPTNFSGPDRLAVDPAGDLWVSDAENDRVLEFQPPFTDGEAASVVIGQSTFSGNQAGLSAVNVSFPIGVAATASWLWVGDDHNHRVLGYPAPFSNGEAATVVLGEPNFTANTATGTNVTAGPVAMAVDGSGDLLVADYLLSRVAEFTPPIGTYAAPALVLGQSSLQGDLGNLSATNLSSPTGVALAPDGTIWVSDSGNNRVLGYVPPTYPVAFAESGLPTGIAWSAVVDGHAYSSTTGAIDVPIMNGTASWSVGSAPAGYRLTSAASGTVTVNGSAPTPVAVIYAAVTYMVEFTETGLPTGTNWSITIGTFVVHATSSTISVTEANGSYGYSVGSSSSAYAPFPVSGTLLVSSGAPTEQVLFTPTSVAAPSASSPTSIWEGLIIGLLVGLVIGGLVAFLLGRRRSPPPGTVAPALAPGTSPAPSPSGGPTAPPWSESPPPPPTGGGPPPGALG
jgi:sugar lactone lactonase YvrE